MYAVIKTGGKQYRVEKDQVIKVELLGDIGSSVDLSPVMIVDGETVHNRVDVTDEEMNEFLGSMTSDNLEQVTNFFETMPKLTHEVSVKNPNTGKTGKVVLEGFQSFFD